MKFLSQNRVSTSIQHHSNMIINYMDTPLFVTHSFVRSLCIILFLCLSQYFSFQNVRVRVCVGVYVYWMEWQQLPLANLTSIHRNDDVYRCEVSLLTSLILTRTNKFNCCTVRYLSMLLSHWLCRTEWLKAPLTSHISHILYMHEISLIWELRTHAVLSNRNPLNSCAWKKH